MQLVPLHHARLRKQPHAIAVRLRWYGMDPTAPGNKIFVERKTHRESWTGRVGTFHHVI
jgi:SPX domain protein involved in polyphosphate accumulation